MLSFLFFFQQPIVIFQNKIVEIDFREIITFLNKRKYILCFINLEICPLLDASGQRFHFN